jgi:hypothetical protein
MERAKTLSTLAPKPPGMSSDGVHAQPLQPPSRPNVVNDFPEWHAAFSNGVNHFQGRFAAWRHTVEGMAGRALVGQLNPSDSLGVREQGVTVADQYRYLLWLLPTSQEMEAIPLALQVQAGHLMVCISNISLFAAEYAAKLVLDHSSYFPT